MMDDAGNSNNGFYWSFLLNRPPPPLRHNTEHSGPRQYLDASIASERVVFPLLIAVLTALNLQGAIPRAKLLSRTRPGQRHSSRIPQPYSLRIFLHTEHRLAVSTSAPERADCQARQKITPSAVLALDTIFFRYASRDRDTSVYRRECGRGNMSTKSVT